MATSPNPAPSGPEAFDDEPFDLEAVEAGAWIPGPYGPTDERGTYNEVTPERTARALAMLDLSRPVRTYDLSETMFNGFPALNDRSYHQTLRINGGPAPAGFDGIVVAEEPIGPWQITSLEERVELTYNMGTKINGLHHVGINGVFYNGYRVDEISQGWGTTKLGNEAQGPIVTRGVLVDVLAYKLEHSPSDTQVLDNGAPLLADAYRITVEDLLETLAWEGVTEPVGPGDVVLIRTGWRELIAADPDRYMLGRRPGPHLRESRWLAARRVAIIGQDSWHYGKWDAEPGVGMLPHQELPCRYGIRVGEAVTTEGPSRDGVYDFVFCFAAQNARGAISGSTPPIAIGQPTSWRTPAGEPTG